MELAAQILWGFIFLIASIALFSFIVLVRFLNLPLLFGYVALVALPFTALFAFDGLAFEACQVFRSHRYDTSRGGEHEFTHNDTYEHFLRFRYPIVASAPLLALALLHFGPRRRGAHKPPPLPQV
jgi:hypothetical protein